MQGGEKCSAGMVMEDMVVFIHSPILYNMHKEAK
jgi:hypothetical protein